jgi:hypothetical protein
MVLHLFVLSPCSPKLCSPKLIGVAERAKFSEQHSIGLFHFLRRAFHFVWLAKESSNAFVYEAGVIIDSLITHLSKYNDTSERGFTTTPSA